MCERIQEASVSIVHLDMYRAQCSTEIRLNAFRGYLFWAKVLQGDRKLHMLIAARKAWEHYHVLKRREDEITQIIQLREVS